MPNPLELAIKSGVKANEMIGDLIADIGTETDPNGYVQAAYRNANRAMQTALQENDKLSAASDVLAVLRDTVLRNTIALLSSAQEQGAGESAKQLMHYKINSPANYSIASISLTTQSQSALDAVMATVDKQSAAVRALVITDAEPGEIVGDDDRTGVLKTSEVAGAAVFWATAILWDAFDWWTNSYSGGLVFSKQAVAALDARTTDCCLHVHAQVQPLNQPFHLTGVPRYADYIDWPAFHGYCRTAGVLYLPQFDDGISARMRKGADYFLTERAAGRHPDRNPANAY